MREFQCQRVFYPNMPPEVIKMGKISAHRECIDYFLPHLFDGTSKIFTIQAFEEERIGSEESRGGYPHYPLETYYRVALRIGQVQTHQVHIETYEEMSWYKLRKSATEEVKYRIKTKIKNFFSNLGGKHG